jgi:hypothetical protein
MFPVYQYLKNTVIVLVGVRAVWRLRTAFYIPLYQMWIVGQRTINLLRPLRVQMLGRRRLSNVNSEKS